MNIKTTRRGFLQLFGVAAAATAATIVVPEIFIPEEPKIRTYFDMGRALKSAPGGWQPIEGQPGIFRDSKTGQIFRMSDWRESDKYDTIVLGVSQFASFAHGKDSV